MKNKAFKLNKNVKLGCEFELCIIEFINMNK